jgi:hypothetical protein
MTIREAAETLGCDVVCGEKNLDKPLVSAFGADLMSDVLTYATENCLLLTGMVNTHVLRTAQILDVPCVMFVAISRPGNDRSGGRDGHYAAVLPQHALRGVRPAVYERPGAVQKGLTT